MSDIWAPELHIVDDYWWVYFCGGHPAKGNASHRMYVLRGPHSSSDPMEPTSKFTFEGPVRGLPDHWAIDGTVFHINGELYMVYSGWQLHSNDDLKQELYITKDLIQLLLIRRQEFISFVHRNIHGRNSKIRAMDRGMKSTKDHNGWNSARSKGSFILREQVGQVIINSVYCNTSVAIHCKYHPGEKTQLRYYPIIHLERARLHQVIVRMSLLKIDLVLFRRRMGGKCGVYIMPLDLRMMAGQIVKHELNRLNYDRECPMWDYIRLLTDTILLQAARLFPSARRRCRKPFWDRCQVGRMTLTWIG